MSSYINAVPPNASGAVYLHPVHHPHNGQARAHFDLDWAAGSVATASYTLNKR